MGQDTTVNVVVSVSMEWKWENSETIQKMYNIVVENQSNYNSDVTMSIKVKKREGSVKDIEEFGKAEELIKCIHSNKKELWDKIKQKYGVVDMYVLCDCDHQYDSRLSSSAKRDKCVMGDFNKTPKECVKNIKKGTEFFKKLGFDSREISLSYIVNDLW
jgi:hypothetical protein